MRSRQRSLDGTKHKSTDAKTPRIKRMKKAGKTKKQIALKKSVTVKQRSGVQAMAATKPSTARIKKTKEEQKTFFGLDLHKKFLQVAAVDQKGNLLMNKRVENDFGVIEQEFSAFPKNAKHVLESSSVWYGVYQKLVRDLDLDVVMSNPYLTRLIAKSKKKADRFDAHALADLLRGGYIHESYVSPPKTVEEKRAIRFRTGMVQNRTRMKNMIHGILLQESIKIPGRTFTPAFNRALHCLKDWRIDEYLKGIISLDERISRADFKINDMVKDNEYAQILMSIPGVGKFTALTIASEIDDISRFTDPNKLVAYVGLAPSVRNSAGIMHHGRITHAGNKTVRWVLTEAALAHMIHAKGTTVLTEFYKRVARKRGTSKAIVATAAKMLRVIFWMLKKRITFAECQRQRTESRRNAVAKHLKNVKDGKGVKDKKGVKDGRKLAKK